jgi:predicted dehydrogenase
MLKIAIVGTGIIVKQHLNAIEHLDDVEIVAVCDVNEEKAKACAEQCGVPYVLDYKEMPSKFDFDAVILNLPHGLHCEASVFFLDVGKHVLVEKPMANTVEECDRMIEASKRNDKRLAIAHIQRYTPAIREAKKIYESGELGKFCMFTENRCENYFYDKRPKWFLSKKTAGGGIAMNFAAHALDKVLSVISDTKIISVDGQITNFANDYDVEAGAQILAKLEGGASATVTLNGYCAVGYDTYFYFTKGALRLANRGLEINRADGQGFVPVEIPASDLPHFALEIDAFHKYIKGEPSDIPTGEYSRQIIDAIQTAYEKSL